MDDFEIFNGAIQLPADKEDARDIMVGDVGGNLVLEDITKNIFAQYNQGIKRETRSFCTHVNALKDICHLWNVELTETMMSSLVVYAVSDGYNIGGADYTINGMKRVCNRRNKNFPTMQSNWIKLDITKDIQFIMDALKLGNQVGVSYNGDEKYNADYRSDCVLDGIVFDGKSKYGHRTSIYMGASTNNKGVLSIRVWDSYFGNKYNDYELAHFLDLYKKGTYRGFLYMFVKNQPVLTEAYKSKIQQQIDGYNTTLNALSGNYAYAGSLQADYHALADKIRAEIIKAQAKIK